MGRIRTRIREDGNRLFDLADERSAAENLMNQRLGLFLIVFAIIIVGVVATGKKIYFLSILFIGAVICWVLAYTIIRLARKIGVLTRDINSFAGSSTSKVDKGGGKTARILLGYFVPIFCSTLLVLIFVIGSTGIIDSYLWADTAAVSQVEHKVDEIKNDVKEQLAPKKENTSAEFKSVDKVIADSKEINSRSNDAKEVKEITKQVTPKSVGRSGDFKNIDSIITPSSAPRTGRSFSRSNPSPQAQTGAGTDSKNFQSIQRIIVEDQSAKTSQRESKKSTLPETLKTKKSSTSQSPPMEGFKDIESVIKK